MTARSQTKTLLLVLVAVGALGCLGTVGIAVVLLSAVGSLGGDGEWSSTAVAERDLPRLYGVRLPAAPLVWDSRAMGFQDGLWEVLVKLPPSSREPFLSMNALTLGEGGGGFEGGALRRIRELEPSTPALKARRVKLPEALQPDGGGWHLYRSATLYEAEGVLWLHLVAHES